MSYQKKYLKYKQKYINLKNQLGGDESELFERKEPLKEVTPILELYQYEIANHPETASVSSPLEYDSLSDNDSECSVYSYSDDPITKFKNSSCDIIINGSKINFLDNYDYYYQYLQNLYKIAKLKNNNILNGSNEQTEENGPNEQTEPNELNKITIPYDSILKLISEYERVFADVIELKNFNECEKLRLNNIDPITIYSNNYVNHIKKINTTNNEKFICIGDVHGSIHSFVRLLFRFHKYGIMDIKTMKINEPYNIVFLGDVIDRGNWGVEIACTLLILLINLVDRQHLVQLQEVKFKVLHQSLYLLI